MRYSRSPHGERGLKCRKNIKAVELAGRSPHGERGLKLSKELKENEPAYVALLTESVD